MPTPLAQPRSQVPSLRSLTRSHLSDAEHAARWSDSESLRKPILHAQFAVRIWHLASLDAPTVAVVWCLALAWAIDVPLPRWVPALLPLGVWAVYIADRLLDARPGIQSLDLDQLHDRHIFHWRHRRILVPVAAICSIAAAWIVTNRMPGILRVHNSLLAAASLAYFARVHTKRRLFPPLSKEFLVGALFALGCSAPIWSRAHFAHAMQWCPLLTATATFVLLAWLNCRAIDRWESSSQRANRYSVSSLGMVLAGLATLCSVLLAGLQFRVSWLLVCAAISALLLAALDRIRTRLTPVTLRAAADLVLLTPAILLAIARLAGK